MKSLISQFRKHPVAVLTAAGGTLLAVLTAVAGTGLVSGRWAGVLAGGITVLNTTLGILAHLQAKSNVAVALATPPPAPAAP